MSHAYGEVKFEDGTILSYEYNATSDVVCSRLHATPKGVQKHWRGDNEANCSCGSTPERVRIMTYYGGGHSWDGTACRKCMAITSGLRPLDEDEEEIGYLEGVPEWSNLT
jgi:hypothetical protein